MRKSEAEIKEEKQKLVEDFPFLDGWEGSVGPGWLPLLRRVATVIEAEVKKAGPLYELRQPYKVGQIKEKFGGLRFYWDDFSNEAIYQAIQAAENLSYTICEDCGDTGTRHSDGWIKTVCDPCWQIYIDRTR